MSSTDLVMTVPLPPLIIEGLEKDFTIHKLWLADDWEALLDTIAPDVRAIAAAVPILAQDRVWPIDAAFMQRFPNLEIVANLGVGYDNIDAKWAKDHNIAVTNTPDVLTEETADTAFGLMLNTIREFSAAERYLRDGKWLQQPYRLTASLQGRTLGILGLGRIGQAIARRAEGFGLKVVYHSRSKVDGADYPYYPDVTSLAQACDILMVVVPGGPDTRNLINARVLKALGPDGVLINIARGTIVDEPALIEALANRTIHAAGLDVFANEPHVPEALMALDNAVLLPHVGSASVITRDAMSQLVVDNLVNWKQGRPLLTPV
ncbi:MAG: 2-hydroxyacid dehydrogenase [Hyphomicrobiales bacterium]|nr:2-hydroxyacid dehydrogenase [Hyphomicrobiales bacterium]